MKIAIIGASGFVGQHIFNEAVSRQHHVTALLRNPAKVPDGPNVTAQAMEVGDAAALHRALVDQDAVVVSVRYEGRDLSQLIDNLKDSGVKRALFVGGAGSLEVTPGVQLVDTPQFPAPWKDSANAARALLNLWRGEKELNWVYVSPSAFIEPGERTGKFRLGKDQLLTDEKGESRISSQDFAVGVLNELEAPAHSRSRFTLGY